MPSTIKTPRNGGIYGIHRVDDDGKRMHCWIVRIERKRRIWNRHFSDGVYGGRTHALRAAQAFRDELLVSHSPMTRAENVAIRRRNNRSGVAGVYRQVDVGISRGKPVERASWVAFWTKSDGKRAIRKFSIGKYGETKAYELAKSVRRRALASMDEPYVTSEGLKNWLRRRPVV